ncbi:hypothetical protein B0H13DRAFT_1909761 [Mycena leptocephala]|nr:hypothetical protein B0H13DRAFT_1909761 [Mycena leptocephala]
MPPKREIPECYKQGLDKRVQCKICPNAKWAAFQKGHINNHLSSAKHRQAAYVLEDRQAGRVEMEHHLSAVVAEKQEDAISSVLNLEKLNLPVFQQAQETPSEAEREMWQNYNKYEADFSAGDQISDEAAQQRVEHEMDQMGIWDAVELGRQLDEVLAALDVSDPFDACDTQADAQKLAEWYPYSSKTMLLLDICDNLPRLPVSESLMRTFIWILKQCGARDVPSLDALRKTQRALRSHCRVPTISCNLVHGKFFCINDPKAIIRMECTNPAICSQFHLYPEANTNGSVSEIWHGDELEGVHYYLDELSQLTDGRFVIPVRWIKADKLMHVDVYQVELDQENKACVKKDMLRVSVTLLKFKFLDLTFKNEIPDWSRAAVDSGFRDRMPNPLRAVAKGDPFYTILVDYMEQTFKCLHDESGTSPSAASD